MEIACGLILVPRAGGDISSGTHPVPSWRVYQIFGADCPIPLPFPARPPPSPSLCLCLVPRIWDLGSQAPRISPGFPSYSLWLGSAQLNPRFPNLNPRPYLSSKSRKFEPRISQIYGQNLPNLNPRSPKFKHKIPPNSDPKSTRSKTKISKSKP